MTPEQIEKVYATARKAFIAFAIMSACTNAVLIAVLIRSSGRSAEDEALIVSLETEKIKLSGEVEYWRLKKDQAVEHVRTNYVLLGASTNSINRLNAWFDRHGDWRDVARAYMAGAYTN